MNRGELLTRLSVWLAIVAYTIGTGLKLEARDRSRWLMGARWAWTVGCGLFLVHVFCAFTYFHHWSHTAAYQETARQTAEFAGWQWGGGLYFNYVFAGAWLADVLWWWLAPDSFDRRSPWLTGLWLGFIFFMVMNGAVVFVHGPMRWVGLLLCAPVASLWVKRWVENSKSGIREGGI